jgi:hypothetical protein
MSFISWCCGPRNKDSESFGTISILITSLELDKNYVGTWAEKFKKIV